MRLLATATLALAGLVLGACSSGDYDDQARGGTLTVYVSSPLRGESSEEGRAIVNGAKLALAEAGGEAGGVDIEAIYMDDTSGEGDDARWDPVIVADNARRAAQDSTAIAYIGELESGATRASLPITNQAMMLQVSAGSTAVDLAQESSASDDVPDLAQPTGERTFGRVIPNDIKQAGAGAVWADELKIQIPSVIEDGSEFGEVVGDEFNEEAEALGLGIRRAYSLVSGTGDPNAADLIYLAGEEVELLAFATARSMTTDAFFSDAEAHKADGL
ncbi:MAG: ABC transporter substrate-binding protein, partial [Solirubrobacterales bacterium]